MDIIQDLYDNADGSIFSALLAYVYLIGGILSAMISFFLDPTYVVCTRCQLLLKQARGDQMANLFHRF